MADNNEVADGTCDLPVFYGFTGWVITRVYSNVLSIVIIQDDRGSAVITDALGSKEDKGSGSFMPHGVFSGGEGMSGSFSGNIAIA